MLYLNVRLFQIFLILVCVVNLSIWLTPSTELRMAYDALIYAIWLKSYRWARGNLLNAAAQESGVALHQARVSRQRGNCAVWYMPAESLCWQEERMPSPTCSHLPPLLISKRMLKQIAPCGHVLCIISAVRCGVSILLSIHHC